jgi:hypothetical protein
MTNTRRVSALAAATLAVSVLAGCSDDSTVTATTSESPTATSPAPTSTTSKPPTESEVAQQAATEVVHDYFATIDRLRQDPRLPLAELKKVAISGQLAAQEIFTRNQRKVGNQQTGHSKVVDMVVQSVNLDNSAPEAGKIPTVQVDVCWDVSQVDILDRQGRSMITAERPDRGWTRYTVANYSWKATHPAIGWRVSNGRDLEKAPCSAA